jgi:hypothetical protein
MLAVWETCFFRKFKFKEIVKWVLYMYSNQSQNFIPFSICDKLFFECVLVHILFFFQHKASLGLDAEGRRVCNHFLDLIMKVLFIPLQVFLSCFVIPWCH